MKHIAPSKNAMYARHLSVVGLVCLAVVLGVANPVSAYSTTYTPFVHWESYTYGGTSCMAYRHVWDSSTYETPGDYPYPVEITEPGSSITASIYVSLPYITTGSSTEVHYNDYGSPGPGAHVDGLNSVLNVSFGFSLNDVSGDSAVWFLQAEKPELGFQHKSYSNGVASDAYPGSWSATYTWSNLSPATYGVMGWFNMTPDPSVSCGGWWWDDCSHALIYYNDPAYGQGVCEMTITTQVPEPSSIIALLGGLAGLLVIRRRKA